MDLTNPSELQPKCLSKKLISFIFCCLLSIALIQFHFSVTPFSFSSTEQLLRNKPVLSTTITTTTTSSSSSSSSSKGIYNTYLMLTETKEPKAEEIQALIQFHFSATPFSFSSTEQLLRNKPVLSTTITTTTTTSSSSSSSSSKEEERAKVQIACDYNNGKWIPDKLGPIYNGTSCGIVTDYQDCTTNGRPDLGYLHWKWKPNQCNIPRFEPKVFLQILRNKHLAFVGDSFARNQVESLFCMLATVSTPHLVYSYNTGDKKIRDKFCRWHFPSHNLNVSIYWSPFLVRGIERRRFKDYCRLYLDSLDEQWAPDLDQMDMIVISFGHWLPQPSLYFFGDSVQGCHKCTGLNYTEVGIYGVFQKILKTTIDKMIDGRGGGSGKGIDVIVTTFSPHHFEGEWDKFGACSRTQPFKEGEKQLEGMEAEMRRIAVAEVEAAKMKAKEFGKRIR
ncbi:hypothetical protein RHGRI_035207 [Rhododendron griersonianum]|uniref:Trichome birefringence-like N-terminal domain-containing protein n=1 Tax=Rhododendron griersonianum TaxID=479676 RepID=A0AAV6I4I6_9ERIC|nr:hypothetical protein RHGRI_035207 [Rhododendron griersonianum]